MFLHNYHTHTYRCHHAQDDVREYIECAIQGGLKTLGFSEHAPYLFPEGHPPSLHRLDHDKLFEYVQTVRTLAKEYEGKIRVLCGFELEYYPDYHKEEMEYLRQVQPDYLILGQHFLGNELGKPCTKQSGDDTLTSYVTQVLAGLATGDFLYLAHPDVIGYQFSERAIDEEYRRLCEGAKRMGIPLEINLLGIREKRHYPDDRFFKIAKEVGNEILIGSDAHSAKVLATGEGLAQAFDMAKRLQLNVNTNPIL